MTLLACYEAMEGDCAAALAVLGNEERVQRYLLRFAGDPTARMLFAALVDARRADAFRAAHTLKGLCRGLGLTRLCASCCALTDALRADGRLEDALVRRVREDYDLAVRAIAALEES